MIVASLRTGLASLAFASVALATASTGLADSNPGKQRIKTVFIIVMENHNWTGDGANSIKGNANAPYINNTLLPMASHADQYFNPPNIHPSLPNYLWLEAGDNFGVKNDGPPSQNHQGTNKHLAILLEKAGVSWKGYMENSSGKTCPLINEGKKDPNGSQLYAVKHDPFVYFDDVTDMLDPHSQHCIDHVRPYKEFAGDLASGNIARYNWITPNLCDDMHDSCGGSSIAHGDTWLSQNVPAILSSAAFQDNGVLFITFDEAHSGDGPIPMIVLSPLAKGGGYASGVHYTHSSTLRTIEKIFGVKPYLGDAKYQDDLGDLFTAFP